ncbi:hypothetical protein [Rhodopirellula sp. SWK7]|uniref:hypothetical protein n=1 Tax=Rhodopirellula sp. SWK7 TaxID=595460 RepID=UPI0002C006D1|nr:hypothetical protein [Rhodopirellula sp. SWK7]EMI44261.1 secreted protein [Rhodopirellula sp. SWK7]
MPCKTVPWRPLPLMFIVCVIPLGVLVLPRVVAADDFSDKVQRLVEKFDDRKQKAREFALNSFDKAQTQVTRSRMPDADRVEAAMRVVRAKADFELTGNFPEDGSMASIQYAYFRQLHLAYTPIQSLIGKEISSASRSGAIAKARSLMIQRASLERDLLGIEAFGDKLAFKGTKALSSGKTMPLNLYLRDISESGTFNGTVDDNPGVMGHWRYEVRGKREGLMLSFAMSKSLRGKFSSVRAEGFLLGDFLVAQFIETIGTKRPGTSYVVLKRK